MIMPAQSEQPKTLEELAIDYVMAGDLKYPSVTVCPEQVSIMTEMLKLAYITPISTAIRNASHLLLAVGVITRRTSSRKFGSLDGPDGPSASQGSISAFVSNPLEKNP